MKKQIKIAAAAAVIGLVLLNLPAANDKPATGAKPDLFADQVVVKGKGVEVKSSQVEEAFIGLKANAAARGQSIPEEQRPLIESRLAEKLAVTQLLLKKAGDEDRKKAKENADKFMAESKKRFASEAAFNTQLMALGLSSQKFYDRVLEQNICEEFLAREVKSTIKVSDESVKKFYDENPAKFEQPEMVRASHILLSTKDQTDPNPDQRLKRELPPEKKKEREQRIRKLKERADMGEDFAKLARENSDDPAAKESGGEYTFPRGQMVKEFETAAFSMKTNQISDVIETAFGYHVIKLSEKIPAKTVPFTEAGPRIKDFLIQQEFAAKSLPAYFAQMKKDAAIEFVGIEDPEKLEARLQKSAVPPAK
jgi:peptidyl-prolyl cis-trans isomerase C